MKLLYGDLRLQGFSPEHARRAEMSAELRAQLRAAVTASKPVVVAFFICSREEAEPYRAGAEAFVDRLFFQEEVDACIEFLRRACQLDPPPS